jgi:hypothetical protein
LTFQGGFYKLCVKELSSASLKDNTHNML